VPLFPRKLFFGQLSAHVKKEPENFQKTSIKILNL